MVHIIFTHEFAFVLSPVNQDYNIRTKKNMRRLVKVKKKEKKRNRFGAPYLESTQVNNQ